MNITIETLSHAPLEFYKELPPRFDGPRLPGGEVLSSSGDFGDLCIQEFDGGNFIIRYSVLHTKEPFTIDAKSHHSGLHAFIMLRNGIAPVIRNASAIDIGEGRFTILQAHQPRATISFGENQQYISFETMLSHPLASSLLDDFPELPEILQQPSPDLPDVWVNPAEQADDEIREHIRYILSYADSNNWRRNYFRNRVWDIVWKLIALYLSDNLNSNTLTDREKNTAHAVHQLILDNLDKHLLIKELAHEVGASESRLKKLFAKVYGKGVHEFRIYQRLKKAIQLLNEGMSVKEAAAETGWRSADLIKAYYKVYGTTPGTIKKKK
ncbi:MAG: helix-turn-helix domain-containing protein [Flavisolibacter sp.]